MVPELGEQIEDCAFPGYAQVEALLDKFDLCIEPLHVQLHPHEVLVLLQKRGDQHFGLPHSMVPFRLREEFKGASDLPVALPAEASINVDIPLKYPSQLHPEDSGHLVESPLFDSFLDETPDIGDNFTLENHSDDLLGQSLARLGPDIFIDDFLSLGPKYLPFGHAVKFALAVTKFDQLAIVFDKLMGHLARTCAIVEVCNFDFQVQRRNHLEFSFLDFCLVDKSEIEV